MTARILLVDDDDLVRDALTELLEDGGYTVCTAGNAAAVLNHCTEGAKFGVLIADLTLAGGIEGPELATVILQRGAAQRVLFISGHQDQRVFLIGQAGPCPVLAKPFGGRELLSAVDAIMSGHGPSPT